jgi:hypothetical protein
MCDGVNSCLATVVTAPVRTCCRLCTVHGNFDLRSPSCKIVDDCGIVCSPEISVHWERPGDGSAQVMGGNEQFSLIHTAFYC